MSRMFFVLLVLGVFAASTYGQQCGVNEEFNSCGSPCEPSCAEPITTVCTSMCEIGCQCKKGFWRNSHRACVKPVDC